MPVVATIRGPPPLEALLTEVAEVDPQPLNKRAVQNTTKTAKMAAGNDLGTENGLGEGDFVTTQT